MPHQVKFKVSAIDECRWRTNESVSYKSGVQFAVDEQPCYLCYLPIASTETCAQHTKCSQAFHVRCFHRWMNTPEWPDPRCPHCHNEVTAKPEKRLSFHSHGSHGGPIGSFILTPTNGTMISLPVPPTPSQLPTQHRFSPPRGPRTLPHHRRAPPPAPIRIPVIKKPSTFPQAIIGPRHRRAPRPAPIRIPPLPSTLPTLRREPVSLRKLQHEPFPIDLGCTTTTTTTGPHPPLSPTTTLTLSVLCSLSTSHHPSSPSPSPSPSAKVSLPLPHPNYTRSLLRIPAYPSSLDPNVLALRPELSVPQWRWLLRRPGVINAGDGDCGYRIISFMGHGMARVRVLVFVGGGVGAGAGAEGIRERREREEEAWKGWEANEMERAWGLGEYDGAWVLRCRVGDED